LNDRLRHRRVDFVGGEVFGSRDSGVVHEDVELREELPHLRGELVDTARILEIDSHPAHPGVGLGDLVEKSLPATGDDHLVVMPMKKLGEGAANPAGSASDEDGVSG
jgi:hypothetical protein